MSARSRATPWFGTPGERSAYARLEIPGPWTRPPTPESAQQAFVEATLCAIQSMRMSWTYQFAADVLGLSG